MLNQTTISRGDWQGKARKFASVGMIFVATLPLLWMAGVFSLAVRARQFLGYWPRPNFPDPQFIPFDQHISILWGSLPVIFAVLLILPPVLFRFGRILERPSRRICMLLVSIGWGIFIVFMTVPRIDFVMWFID